MSSALDDKDETMTWRQAPQSGNSTPNRDRPHRILTFKDGHKKDESAEMVYPEKPGIWGQRNPEKGK